MTNVAHREQELRHNSPISADDRMRVLANLLIDRMIEYQHKHMLPELSLEYDLHSRLKKDNLIMEHPVI